jgi:hypothetical protein
MTEARKLFEHPSVKAGDFSPRVQVHGRVQSSLALEVLAYSKAVSRQGDS